MPTLLFPRVGRVPPGQNNNSLFAIEADGAAEPAVPKPRDRDLAQEIDVFASTRAVDPLRGRGHPSTGRPPPGAVPVFAKPGPKRNAAAFSV